MYVLIQVDELMRQELKNLKLAVDRETEKTGGKGKKGKVTIQYGYIKSWEHEINVNKIKMLLIICMKMYFIKESCTQMKIFAICGSTIFAKYFYKVYFAKYKAG